MNKLINFNQYFIRSLRKKLYLLLVWRAWGWCSGTAPRVSSHTPPLGSVKDKQEVVTEWTFNNRDRLSPDQRFTWTKDSSKHYSKLNFIDWLVNYFFEVFLKIIFDASVAWSKRSSKQPLHYVNFSSQWTYLIKTKMFDIRSFWRVFF